MEKISVIVPVYNTEQFLERCILSIINQEYSNLEIILVNDGSTDRSLEICNYYAKKDYRIIVINNQNGGVSSARNSGLDIATGDYIGFIDSDDYISPDMYKVLLENALKQEADIVECGYYVCDSSNEPLIKRKFNYKIINGSYNCSIDYISTTKRYSDFNWNKLYKRFIFDDLRFQNFSYSEDFAINVQAYYKCNRKVTINSCHYYYIKHENGATSINRTFKKSRLDGIKAGIEMYKFHLNRFRELCPFIALYITEYTMFLYNILCKLDDQEYKFEKKELEAYFKKYYVLITGDAYKLIFFNKILLKFMLFNFSPKSYEKILRIKNSGG